MMLPSPCCVRKLVAQLAAGNINRPAFRCTLQHYRKLIHRKGLGQIIRGPGAHRFNCRVHRSEGGHYDHRNLRVQHLDFLEQLKTGPSRRFEIEKKDVDTVAAQQAPCGGEVVNSMRRESPAGGNFAACRAYRSVFVDDQDMQPSRTL